MVDQFVELAKPSEDSYGKVRYVQYSEPSEYDRMRSAKPLKDRFFLLAKGRTPREESLDVRYLADQVVRSGKIRKIDLDRLPKGNSDLDRIKLANAFVVIVDTYNRIQLQNRRNGNTEQCYELGLVLADFLSAIPRRMAARFLEAASDPKVSQAVLKGDLAHGVQGLESEQYAVEAAVLLPRQARVEIFTEMARLQTPKNQRAFNFFRNVAANWSQSGKKFCGQDAIKVNLPAEQVEAKTDEVLEDIQITLGPIVRNQPAARR